MITLSARGKLARNPKRAIACSWLPQTCITEIGARPIAAQSLPSSAVSSRPRWGSRNSSARPLIRLSAIFFSLARRNFAAHVGRHQVLTLGLAQQFLIEREGCLNFSGGDFPDRVTDVVEHVIAGNDRLVHDVEQDRPAHSEKIDRRHHPVDL